MKKVILSLLGLTCLVVGTAALAASASSMGIAHVANTAKGNLESIAKLITAASYVAGMAFAVGAIVKFKAHKDNPTQIPIGTPIALLFTGAALMFAPSVFKTSGQTLFGGSGMVAGTSGMSTFGVKAGSSGGK